MPHNICCVQQCRHTLAAQHQHSFLFELGWGLTAFRRRYLQMGLGLEVDPGKPIVACITRLVPQKVTGSRLALSCASPTGCSRQGGR